MGDIVTREQVASLITRYFSQQLSDDEKVAALNHFRLTLHELSPFAREPVDLVLWVKASEVVANDYNPNVMAAGEKKLLQHSLQEDGFTQPVTCINPERKGKAERIASTIRHNRARGKHQIASMSDIVRDLARLGWADERIGKELGMDRDEVLRLKQISGLTELFEEEDFSPAWTVR